MGSNNNLSILSHPYISAQHTESLLKKSYILPKKLEANGYKIAPDFLPCP